MASIIDYRRDFQTKRLRLDAFIGVAETDTVKRERAIAAVELLGPSLQYIAALEHLVQETLDAMTDNQLGVTPQEIQDALTELLSLVAKLARPLDGVFDYEGGYVNARYEFNEADTRVIKAAIASTKPGGVLENLD